MLCRWGLSHEFTTHKPPRRHRGSLKRSKILSSLSSTGSACGHAPTDPGTDWRQRRGVRCAEVARGSGLLGRVEAWGAAELPCGTDAPRSKQDRYGRPAWMQLVGQGLPTEAWGSPRHGLALCKQPLESQLAEALCHLAFDRGTHLGGAATLCPDVARRGAAAGLAIGSRAKTCTVEPSRSPSDTSVCGPRWSSSMMAPRSTTTKQEALTPRERASVALKHSRVALAGKMWQRRSPQRSETITCSVEPQRGAKSLESYRPGSRSRVRAASKVLGIICGCVRASWSVAVFGK